MIKDLRDARLVDAVPRVVAGQDWVRALSEAVGVLHERTLRYIDDSQIYTSLDTATEPVLDALAINWKVDWYDTGYSVEQKRRIIKTALTVRRLMGTVGAVKLQGMMNGSYVLGPYRKLWVYVPKKRLVMALDYPDRIVQWSLYLYLNPLYDRLFIEDSYACRKDKGSHKAAKRLQYWMCQVQRKPGPGWYCLKLDISKYFYRVNHEKLLAILERRVKDPAMIAFIRGVVNSRAEPFGLPRWRTPQDTPPEEWLYEVGMPIGNLTSQLFANIYLNELDQYCKHRLKIHYYIRYMDDVIILGQDKETLHRWKAAVETFLQEELALDLNSKTSIRPVCQGVEFVGVRIWPTHMKLRKSTVRRIKREVRKISALYAAGDMTRQDFYRRIASIRGLLKHTESASLRWRLNEIYRAELEKAKQKQLREEAQYEPFADHSGAGNGDGNAGTGYQDHGNPACRAG